MYAHLLWAGSFIAAISFLLSKVDHPAKWWQITIIMIGGAMWDWGWHSWAHHKELWSAKPWVRLLGLLIALSVPTMFFFSPR